MRLSDFFHKINIGAEIWTRRIINITKTISVKTYSFRQFSVQLKIIMQRKRKTEYKPILFINETERVFYYFFPSKLNNVIFQLIILK